MNVIQNISIGNYIGGHLQYDYIQTVMDAPLFFANKHKHIASLKGKQDYYIGEYSVTLRHGKGIWYNSINNHYYIGDFVNDKFHGKGRYSSKLNNVPIREGKWDDGNFFR